MKSLGTHNSSLFENSAHLIHSIPLECSTQNFESDFTECDKIEAPAWENLSTVRVFLLETPIVPQLSKCLKFEVVRGD